MSQIKKAKIEKYYSKVATAFIILAAAAVVIIIYFSLSQTTILVTLDPQTVKSTAVINIVPAGTEVLTENSLEGKVIEKTISGTKTYKDLATLRTAEAKASGTVTIYNQNSSAQPLVATTRLLSEEGVLFRTKGTVAVPAGGQVEVAVEADQEGEQGNIGPSHFTVVALWKGMQDKVYGESSQSMTGGLKDVMIATLENINTAKEQLATELKEQALQELSREIAKDNPDEKIIPDAVTYQILSEEADVEPNAEVNQFTVESKLKIITTIFDEDKLFELMSQKLTNSLSADKELAMANKESLEYSVKSYDLEQQTAQLEITLSGSTYLKLSSSIFNRDNLTNKDKQDIRTYFNDFSEIQNVEVKFSPFWVFRSPALKDHIEIKIQK